MVVAVVVAVLLLTRSSANGPYTVSAWEYGAIAWVDPAPADVTGRAVEAAELFEAVYELWGFEPPAPVDGGRVARRGDPAGGPSIDLRATEWRGSLVPPIVVVVFPDTSSFAAATGMEGESVTLTYGGGPERRFDEETVEASLASWLTELTGASVAFVCAADRWEESLVGEAAKWMLRQAMQIPDLCECTPYSLPRLLREGFAGYSTARILDRDDRLEEARAWAAENEISTNIEGDPLNLGVEGETLTVLGTSFVTHLLEEYADDELVREICAWRGYTSYCGPSTSKTLRYLRGWRDFLVGTEEEA